jgi:hypothetical protein
VILTFDHFLNKSINTETFPISLGVSKTNTEGLSKVTLTVIVAVVVIVVAAGAVLAYSMMSPSVGTNPSSSSTSSSSQSNSSSNSSSTTASDSLQGYQTGYTPQGAWTKYLGYIPTGYKVAPREPNAPVFPCPTGMSATECKSFQQTCGNGVCDPNETCGTCPIDCPVTGSMTCDPYTGRAGAPASVCQVQLAQAAQGAG